MENRTEEHFMGVTKKTMNSEKFENVRKKFWKLCVRISKASTSSEIGQQKS